MTGHGLDLQVRLTPKADRNSVEGLGADAQGRAFLQCRVRAVPEKGRANEALERLLADYFGLRRSDVAVIAGATSRRKTVRLNVDPARAGTIASALDALRDRPG